MLQQSLMNTFKGKKVLVTGHTGFKGSWLTRMLLLWGADIVAVSLKPRTEPNLFSVLGLAKQVKHHIFDIQDYDQLENLFLKEKPEIVFHLAAQAIVRVGYEEPRSTFGVNTMGSVNILEAIRRTDSVNAVVMATTDKVYENQNDGRYYTESDRIGGSDPYSASKSAAELAICAYRDSFFTEYRPLVASVRAGNVIGGGDWARDRIVPDIVRSIFERQQPVEIRNASAVRPWQYVLEPLYGYCLLAQKLINGEHSFTGAWNFGPHEGNVVPVLELVKESIHCIGTGDVILLDDTVEKLKKPEANMLMLDSQKAHDRLGWRPIYSVDDTIQKTMEWYTRFYAGGDMISFTQEQISAYVNKIK